MSTLAITSSYYKEHLGIGNLSRKFQSNQVFTPAHVDRCTISEANFKRYFDATPKVPKTPWGRSLSYGGLGRVNLPDGSRSKWEPPTRVQKGHFHYGAGVMPHPDEMKVKQFYSLTPLNKSKVRTNDQLIPSPNQENIGNFQINSKFPAEHPYNSHLSRFALFPTFDTPTDMCKGETRHLYQATLPPEVPASAPEVQIIGKSRGSPARHERISVSRSSERNPLKWIDGPNFYQLPKGPGKDRQNYYPCPPSTVRPASGAILENTAVTPRTAGSLSEIHKAMWVSTYRKDFTGKTEIESSQVLSCNADDVAASAIYSSSSPYPESSSWKAPIETERKEAVDRNKSFSPDLSRRSSLETLYRQETELTAKDSAKSSKPNTSATPKSVQFRRSVTFSDGKSLREIPLNGDATPEPEPAVNLYAKTPYPEHSTSDNIEPWNMPSSNPGSLKIPQNSKSVNNMPSQMKDAEPTFDPSCPPKFFRPHTVGCSRSSTELLKVRDNWSRSAASRQFRDDYLEDTPDLRRKPDLRFTTNEKRHVIPEAKAHTYLFRNSDHM